jgi:hypothetical protein
VDIVKTQPPEFVAIKIQQIACKPVEASLENEGCKRDCT